MFMSNGSEYKVEEVGFFQILRKPKDKLQAGQVGYIIAGIKMISDVSCGDTVTLAFNPAINPCLDSGSRTRWFFHPCIRWLRMIMRNLRRPWKN